MQIVEKTKPCGIYDGKDGKMNCPMLIHMYTSGGCLQNFGKICQPHTTKSSDRQ